MNAANVVILTGRLGADPEAKTTGDKKWCTLNIAVNGYRKKEKVTDWFDVVVGGVTSENVVKYCAKGDKITVVGTNTTKVKEDDSGNKRKFYNIVADAVEFQQLGSSDSKGTNTEESDDDLPF